MTAEYLVNNGNIVAGGGDSGSNYGSQFPGYGSRITVSGRLLNDGTMALGGGIYDTNELYPVGGAVLDVSGTLTMPARSKSAREPASRTAPAPP